MNPKIDKQFQVSVAEHQILLSFNNDADALVFENWWYIRGRKDYNTYFDSFLPE